MASNLVEYYRNLAARGGTQAAMTSARPTRAALSPEILERYESSLSRGSSTTGTAATATGTTTAPALTADTSSAPALTSFESLSTQPAITGADLSGEGGISATDNLSGLSPTYGSMLGESMGKGMQSGMTTGAITGGIIGAIAGIPGGVPGVLTGGIIGAGVSAAKGAVSGLTKGIAESLYGFFMGEMSLDDLVGYSTSLGLSEGLQNQVSDSFNLDASTPEGFVGGYTGASDSFGFGYGGGGALGGGSTGGFGGISGGMDGGAGDSMGGSGAGGFA